PQRTRAGIARKRPAAPASGAAFDDARKAHSVLYLSGSTIVTAPGWGVKLPGLILGTKYLKQQLEHLLQAAVRALAGGTLPDAPDPAAVSVERTRDAQHGDFATNVALRLAKAARRNPRELAQAIVAALPSNPLIARTEVAG